MKMKLVLLFLAVLLTPATRACRAILIICISRRKVTGNSENVTPRRCSRSWDIRSIQ